MKISQAILARRSVRDFLDTPVDINLINQALELAKYAPSSTNMQPWEVAVVSGDCKQQLCDAIKTAHQNECEKTPDYQGYPSEWFEPFNSRRKSLGISLYKTLGVEKGDKQGQIAQWIRNYEAFNAPNIVFVLMDNRLAAGSYIDCGMFIQSFMLALLDRNLASCPQAAFIDYSALIKSFLGIESHKTLLAGIAVGYPNADNPVNHFARDRVALDEFTTYYS